MRYEIKYEWMGKARHISSGRLWLKYMGFLCMGLCACAFLLWTVGGDWSVTVNALEGMAADLQNGINVNEAFSSFCIEVLEGA